MRMRPKKRKEKNRRLTATTVFFPIEIVHRPYNSAATQTHRCLQLTDKIQLTTSFKCSVNIISCAQHQHQHLKSVTIQIVLTHAYFVVQKSDYSDASLLWLMALCHRFSLSRRWSSNNRRTSRRSIGNCGFSTSVCNPHYRHYRLVHHDTSLCNPLSLCCDRLFSSTNGSWHWKWLRVFQLSKHQLHGCGCGSITTPVVLN